MQELVVPIAIVSLILVISISIIKEMKNKRGDDAMVVKKINYKRLIENFLFDMSVNLAGGALLAQVLQF